MLYKNEKFVRDLNEVYVECKNRTLLDSPKNHNDHSMMETFDKSDVEDDFLHHFNVDLQEE